MKELGKTTTYLRHANCSVTVFEARTSPSKEQTAKFQCLLCNRIFLTAVNQQGQLDTQRYLRRVSASSPEYSTVVFPSGFHCVVTRAVSAPNTDVAVLHINCVFQFTTWGYTHRFILFAADTHPTCFAALPRICRLRFALCTGRCAKA